MKVLIACEESQTVCKEFRKLGHEAYSCDILPCSGDHPEWHFQQDLFEIVNLMTWDLIIAHPPCNYLTVTGNKWMKPDQYIHPYYFGDPHSKKTGLWLKGLPLLVPTKMVEPVMYTYKDGRKDPMWHVITMKLPPNERSKERSKTFQGFAEQMALQWGGKIN